MTDRSTVQQLIEQMRATGADYWADQLDALVPPEGPQPERRAIQILRRLIEEPHGCRFCDSGKLRTPSNPFKDHDRECGFAQATAFLASLPPEGQEPQPDASVTLRIQKLARSFAAEWVRPDDPDHATEKLVDTLSTAMLAFHACARGVEQRVADWQEVLASGVPAGRPDGWAEERSFLITALAAARDALAAFQKQAGALPQGGYATTLTEAEMRVARAVADLDKILAGVAGRPDGWQEIASAPKDGSFFIGLDKLGDIGRIHWCTQYEPHTWADKDGFFITPVAWMPLPVPPVRPRQGE